MNELTDKMKRCYSYHELIKLKENIKDYIVPYEKIDWQVMDSYQMTKFMEENYNCDKEDSIFWYDMSEKTPICMHYLVFPPYPKDMKFFVGTILNNVNKRTIIGCICYKDVSLGKDCKIVTSIETIEINYFYQGKGLLKEISSLKNLHLDNALSKIFFCFPSKNETISTISSSAFKRSISFSLILLKNLVVSDLYNKTSL